MLLAEQFFVVGFVWFAEREGFEPSVPCGTHAFQACSIGHSDTSPGMGVRIYDLYPLIPFGSRFVCDELKLLK